MTRISLLGLASAFVLSAVLGCSDSSAPEREKGKTAITDREENLAKDKDKGGGKFMRPKGLPGDQGNKDKKN